MCKCFVVIETSRGVSRHRRDRQSEPRAEEPLRLDGPTGTDLLSGNTRHRRQPAVCPHFQQRSAFKVAGASDVDKEAFQDGVTSPA